MKQIDLPPVVWAVPFAGLILLPALADGPVGTRLSVLFAELLLGLPVLLATPAPLRPLIIPFPRLTRGWWAICCLAPLVLAPAYQLVHWLLSQWLAMPAQLEEAMRRALQAHGPLENLLLWITALAVAPVMEELLFRGLLPWIWRTHVGPRGSLVAPAMIFAACHFNVWNLPSLFLLGLLLGLLRERSASLLPGILLHAAVNTLGLWLLMGSAP